MQSSTSQTPPLPTPLSHTPPTLHPTPLHPMPRFLWPADSMQPGMEPATGPPDPVAPPGRKTRRAQGRLKPGSGAHIPDGARICPTVRKEAEEDGGGRVVCIFRSRLESLITSGRMYRDSFPRSYELHSVFLGRSIRP